MFFPSVFACPSSSLVLLLVLVGVSSSSQASFFLVSHVIAPFASAYAPRVALSITPLFPLIMVIVTPIFVLENDCCGHITITALQMFQLTQTHRRLLFVSDIRPVGVLSCTRPTPPPPSSVLTSLPTFGMLFCPHTHDIESLGGRQFHRVTVLPRNVFPVSSPSCLVPLPPSPDGVRYACHTLCCSVFRHVHVVNVFHPPPHFFAQVRCFFFCHHRSAAAASRQTKLSSIDMRQRVKQGGKQEGTQHPAQALTIVDIDDHKIQS